jgi:hypothetical protein
MSNENQTHLIGDFRHDEATAADTVTPSMLVESDANGEVQPHSTADGVAELAFAEIDGLQGKTLDDDYSTGDLVMINREVPGNVTQAWLAVGENVAAGALLASNGDGTLKAGTTNPVAVAREALDLTGSGAALTRLAVRVL